MSNVRHPNNQPLSHMPPNFLNNPFALGASVFCAVYVYIYFSQILKIRIWPISVLGAMVLTLPAALTIHWLRGAAIPDLEAYLLDIGAAPLLALLFGAIPFAGNKPNKQRRAVWSAVIGAITGTTILIIANLETSIRVNAYLGRVQMVDMVVAFVNFVATVFLIDATGRHPGFRTLN